MSVTSWFLVSSSGTRHRLPREMIFVGREDCELMLQSRSVDKQHAVINFDANTDEHMVKDLGSLNGTFVNDLRIPEQTYITLKLSDVIRFGYDAHVYILEKSQHMVPEEALKHEKYTSQLQIRTKTLEAKVKEKLQLQSSGRTKDSVSSVKGHDKTERRAHSLAAATDPLISRPTPLYGQPSWWGDDDDPAHKKQTTGPQESTEPAEDVSRHEINGCLPDSGTKSILSSRREPSYFKIPTKEFLQQSVNKSESQVQEVPTKDTTDTSQCVSSTTTPAVVQSHASFTIEFDDCTPGKMKIKDHVTKFSFRQQRKLPSAEVAATPTKVMSSENKVADWLVQSDASMSRRRSQADHVYYINSDTSALKMDDENYSKDALCNDTEDPVINGNNFVGSGHQVSSQVSQTPQKTVPDSYPSPESQVRSCPRKAEHHQAFVIEFFDNAQKKHSQSCTDSMAQLDLLELRTRLEKASKSSSPTGERTVSSPPYSPSTPPTQRYTVPLKDSGSSISRRTGSLHGEKTEDRLSSSFSSRSSSFLAGRPFSSVGKRSKLAREFAAKFLKQAKQTSSASWEQNSPPETAQTRPENISPPEQSPSSPTPSTPFQPQTSSPIHQPVPLTAPVMPLVSQTAEPKSPHGTFRNEEDDSLSDAGTYTIETDVQDKDVEEARSQIDQVFGVVESPEPTSQRESETPAAFRPVIIQGREQHRQDSCGELRAAPEQGQSQAQLEAEVFHGGLKWMSCWASLADSCAESGCKSEIRGLLSQMELSEAGKMIHKPPFQQRDNNNSDGSRAWRILPEVPPVEKNATSTPSIHVQCDLQSTFDIGENTMVSSGSQDDLNRLKVQDDVEPDSLSDASKSDDGSIVEQRTPQSDTEEKKPEDNLRLPTKSSLLYIGSEETLSKPECGGSIGSAPMIDRKVNTTFSTATLTKHQGKRESAKIKPTISAPLVVQQTQNPDTREGVFAPLVRQESFTMDHPSSSRLPNISSQPALVDPDSDSSQRACHQDTHSYLKETEDVLAALEAKLQAVQPDTTPTPVMDSLSGESDMDTSSTVSQQSSKTRPSTLTKKTSNSCFHREQSSGSLTSQDSNQHFSTTEHLEGKCRSLVADCKSRSDAIRKPAGLRRRGTAYGSTDFSDDLQGSGIRSSDQESSTNQIVKKYTIPLQKDDCKTSKVAQVLSRTKRLAAPRPTRTSILRRARLGGASDNEGPETEKQVQETGNLPAKHPQEVRKLSRLDMLAMPRKRTGSFNTQSDTEASVAPVLPGRMTGFSNRSTEFGGNCVRRASAPGLKPVGRPQKAPLNKTLITRGRSSSAKYASSTATSNSPCNQSRPLVALHPKPQARESGDENQDGQGFHSWSTHSAEIARLSQDLAKDLAILAREIHDVAGDGDPKSDEVESFAPAFTVTAHEQLMQRIPEAGLNYPRVPVRSSAARESEEDFQDSGENWQLQIQNRDETAEDSRMLNPMSQIIIAIKDNTDQLAEKMKVLFQDKMDVWDKIEARVNSNRDLPAIKTSNKEIVSILKELKSVQQQLEVINAVVGPAAHCEAPRTSAYAALSLATSRSSKSSMLRDWRTVHSVARRGGGLRCAESSGDAGRCQTGFRKAKSE
ncbi:centrosomal protein of 170 kDa protein B isoform X2 [Thalassophryne amazonica]|uniref:centrosomal protein of 170 kDa protein B isoform X2 n=1 Tax=Thalassophryne amazonica TaxID=390379 RepID=UPI0014714E14|nr:centrosomal protein of 170 kDa protein B isoform X2 [Thalassophryne amazonica]